MTYFIGKKNKFDYFFSKYTLLFTFQASPWTL